MCIIVGGLSLFVGGQLINKSVLSEANNRIRLDLNAAREIYNNVTMRLNLGLRLTSLEDDFQSAVKFQAVETITSRLEEVAGEIKLDFAGIVTAAGSTLCRIGADGTADRTTDGTGSDNQAKSWVDKANPAALLALEHRSEVLGTVILDRDALLSENPELAERARIELIPTPRAAPRPEEEETAGMTITCAVPVSDGAELLGVLYGGVLLNRSVEIVDLVRETVFQQETLREKSIGTATIFFKDLRISTNVMTPGGDRAIGTRVSKEVRDKVLVEGERWTDRAFVVHDWYITAYEPIVDITGDRVGILYVGILEARYMEIRRNTLLVFVLITAAGMVLAIVLGYVLGQRIWKPMHQLIEASRKVSSGDLSPEIGDISKDEIGDLQRTFMEMLSSLRERDKRQKAESESKLLRSEKQASVGRLAAGVAHEINNPLTGVLTFTHMLLRRTDISGEIRQDLETIAQATERVRNIVKGLLDFSRQTEIEPEPADVNALIEETIGLVTNQALVKGIQIRFDPGEGLPVRTLDKSQFQSVLLNIIINAIDATDSGGRIKLTTGISISADRQDRKGIEISISDTGHGISADHLDKLFDPFFTTKEVGKGTGLGLSVSLGIVERHGGTIRVQSGVGRGSTFVIWLPFDKDEN